MMVTLKKSGKGCGEKLAGRNLLFPPFKVVDSSNGTAFSAKNSCLVQQERKQQQQEGEEMGSAFLAGDMGIGCEFYSLFNLPGPNLF